MVNVDEAGHVKGGEKGSKSIYISNTLLSFQTIYTWIIMIYTETNTTVLGHKDRKEAFVKGQKQQALVTIIDAVNATGFYLDLGIVFQGKEDQYQCYKRIMLECIHGCHFSVSPTAGGLEFTALSGQSKFSYRR